MSKTAAVPPTLAAWSNAGLHVAQLETGAWVKFRYPDLSILAATDKVPDDLKPVALKRIAKELTLLIQPPADAPDPEPTLDGEKLQQTHQLDRLLICEMVKAIAAADAELDEQGIPVAEAWEEVELTPAEVEAIPHEDLTMLSEFAERQRDTDARGVVMGVMPLSRLARFRAAHSCRPHCEACESLRREGLLRRASVGSV